MNEFDYLYEKHTDAEEPNPKDILEIIAQFDKIAENLPPMKAEDEPEWGMCYHEDLR